MRSPLTRPEDDDEVTRLRRALERSQQELDQFVYVTSHDLKAPLRGIVTLSQWLEEDLGEALTGESRHQLELLRRRVQRMERLLESLLQYSRAGRIRGAPEKVELPALLREVEAQLKLQPPAQLLADPELPQVVCVRAALQQVLVQLISNALRHARRGPDLAPPSCRGSRRTTRRKSPPASRPSRATGRAHPR